MKVEIKKKGNTTAILISFDTQNEKFESPSEKSKFFEKLYGRNQTIKKEKKKYFYRRTGLMDEVPHIKVDNSVFIIAMEQMKMMEQFMNEWEEKVMFKTFPVLLDEEEAEQLQEIPIQTEESFKPIEVPKKKKGD
ncbi:MAG: hypothetical protein PHU12_00875 [Candidatus Aenigmarchaeota archaeon]|nr:hypothetical protein [Candidatus Aenigmarchaeota archaeon]